MAVIECAHGSNTKFKLKKKGFCVFLLDIQGVPRLIADVDFELQSND